MIKNIKKFFKGFFKNNYKLIIIYTFLILLFTVPLNYEIYTPGGLINLDGRITIDNSYENKGSLNLTYVGGKKGIIPMILLSYVIPNWDLVSLNESRIENEDYTEIVERNKVYLDDVNKNAIIVAYKAASKEYKIINNNVTILHVFDYAETNIKTGDIILSVNNIKINNSEELKNIVSSLKENQKVNLKINRNDSNLDCYAIIKEIDGKNYIGLYLADIEEVETNPKVDIKFNSNEMGPSGGLMTALEIYNLLVDEDITKGSVISGTGTIESDGVVGAISGIKYKLAGAVKNKADVFIVPTDNYKEALKEKEDNNYDIELIEADTFESVLQKLLNR